MKELLFHYLLLLILFLCIGGIIGYFVYNRKKQNDKEMQTKIENLEKKIVHMSKPAVIKPKQIGSNYICIYISMYRSGSILCIFHNLYIHRNK